MLMEAGVNEGRLFGSRSQEQGTSVSPPHKHTHVLLVGTVRDSLSLLQLQLTMWWRMTDLCNETVK